MQSSQDPQKIILASVGAVVTGVAMTTVLKVCDQILGDTYSAADQEKLRHLTHLYKQCLKTKDAPLTWVLDNNKRPAYCFVPHRKYEQHVEEKKENQHSVKNYNYYSWLLIETIVQYLEQRKVRVVGKGKNGDLVEQFLCEWLTWAIEKLPNLEYDETSIKILEARRDYINQVMSHAKLFVQGRVSRDIEKFDVFNIIHKELTSCIKKAKEEQSRISSQKLFEICQQNTSGLLLECLKVIYYFRGEAAYKFPLFIDDYSKSNNKDKLTNIAKILYPKIRESHTGAMLYATIVQAGVDTFDVVTKEESDVLISEYFDEAHRIKEVKWDIAKSDLPDWIRGETEKEEQLIAIQKLCECILRLSAIKKLIVAAYALTGSVGDSWAYGDKQGKHAIKSLLYVFDDELEKLENQFEEFYEFHSAAANRFNHVEKRNPNTQTNLNFSKISAAVVDMKKLADLLKKNSQEIKVKIDKYPQDADSYIDGLKQYFYSSLNSFIKTYYPLRNDLFSHIPQSQEPTSAFYSFRHQQKLNSDHELRVYEIGECYYQLRLNEAGQLYCVKEGTSETLFPLIQFNKNSYKKNWMLGQSYQDWHSGFFNRNRPLFTIYNDLLQVDLIKAVKSKDINSINTVNEKIQKSMEAMLNKIESERPKWRFNPLTLGWPFHSTSRLFAKAVAKDMLHKKNRLDQYISASIKYIRHEIGEIDPQNRPTAAQKSEKVVSAVKEQTLQVEQKLSDATTQPLSQAVITQRLQSAQVVPIRGELLTNNRNQFMKWYTEFNDLFNTWQENDFSEEFKAIHSHDEAKLILESCLSHHENLKGKDKSFISNCYDLQHSLILVMESNSTPVTVDSNNQIELVVKLLAVILSVANERQIKLEEYEVFCTSIFTKAAKTDVSEQGQLSRDSISMEMKA
jgi:hypothetical protein